MLRRKILHVNLRLKGTIPLIRSLWRWGSSLRERLYARRLSFFLVILTVCWFYRWIKATSRLSTFNMWCPMHRARYTLLIQWLYRNRRNSQWHARKQQPPLADAHRSKCMACCRERCVPINIVCCLKAPYQPLVGCTRLFTSYYDVQYLANLAPPDKYE